MASDEYEFKGRRGIAVILVNENFEQNDLSIRRGARKDLEMAEKTFRRLGFEVKAYFNQTASQMLDRMKQATGDKDIEKMDCFVCVISSHGDPLDEEGVNYKSRTDWIWGTDRDIKIDTLLAPLTEAQCPGLAGKPKLCFIQACRGGRVSKAVEVVPGKIEEERSQPAFVGSTSESTMQNIPIQRDFMLAWAVPPEFIAFHRKSGSWFIKAICIILDDYAVKCQQLVDAHAMEKLDISKIQLARYMHENLQNFDIMTLMTMVNNYVGTKFISRLPSDDYLDKKKCMPWVAHQLTKEVFLHKMFLQTEPN